MLIIILSHMIHNPLWYYYDIVTKVTSALICYIIVITHIDTQEIHNNTIYMYIYYQKIKKFSPRSYGVRCMYTDIITEQHSRYTHGSSQDYEDL